MVASGVRPPPPPRRRRAFSNKLSDAEAERLAIVIEEAAEVQQVACKILRHGYASVHPNGGEDNRQLLQKELGDFAGARELMFQAGDVARKEVAEQAVEKIDSLREYTHHQPENFLDAAEARLQREVLRDTKGDRK